MRDSVNVKEKYSNYWKPTLYASLLLALVAFFIYLNLDDVLWAGISRLIAFMSLSLGIFCMLKVMEGVKTFEVEFRDDSILISYLKNEDIIGNDKLKLDEIQSIYREPYELKIPFTDFGIPLSGSSNFKVAFKNEEESDITLFKFGGRALAVDEHSGQKLEHFFRQHDLFLNPK